MVCSPELTAGAGEGAILVRENKYFRELNRPLFARPPRKLGSRCKSSVKITWRASEGFCSILICVPQKFGSLWTITSWLDDRMLGGFSSILSCDMPS